LSDFNRKFNAGRQSELLYNEELAAVFESIKHLLEVPEGKESIPHPKIHGSFWWDRAKNELNYYDKAHDRMVNVFKPKFQLIDQMLSLLPPTEPVYGQIWLNNGVLYYFDGVNWAPIKALNVDSSQLNMSAFEDFILLSPLNKAGNTVIENDYDVALENYERAILESKLDIPHDAKVSEVDNYAIGDKLFAAELELPLIPKDAKTQFLVVNANVDRLFINNDLSLDYDVVNQITIQYPKWDIIGKRNSLVHVNPGKITSIEKRMLKIDRFNPTFYMTTQNTEFYGFKKGERLGRFLKPVRSTQDDSYDDYTYVEGGINLTYNASQNFDYILAITYHFSWIKSSGHLKKTSSNDSASSYYIPKATAPLNVFVDGYDLENTFWEYDGLSQVVTIKDNTRDNEVSVWQTLRNEYGWIKQYTIDNRGILKTVTNFREPLIFVNGEAFAATAPEIEINGNEIYIAGGKRDMCWGIVELYDEVKGESLMAEASVVSYTTGTGEDVIYFDSAVIPDDCGLVLFVNGLLVKNEDIVRNNIDHYLSVNGLQQGDDYIILIDKNSNMIAEKDLSAAMYVGRNDESLVYMNNSLLCNSTALVTTASRAEKKLGAVNNEVKAFIEVVGSSVAVNYCIYDYADEVWIPLEADDITAMQTICFSYDNTTSAIKINFDYEPEDVFTVFAYSFANSVEHPLIVRNTWAHDESDFTVESPFEPGTGALSVWLDGIRLYSILEYKDGTGFSLSAKVSGKITYVIEKAETGHEKACEREILTYENILGDAPNVYKTEMSLYPGRVTVYVSGLRMPKNSWTILDNNTIMFKDITKKLIGNSETYPEMTIRRNDSKVVKIPITTPDQIMIEVRQEFKRIEQSIEWSDPDETEIGVNEYSLPQDILEAADEILIFINGTFTGLTNNSGYYKDRAKGCITFLVGSATGFLNTDPMYNVLATDQVKKLAYEAKHGHPYERKVQNLITLEWR